MKIDFIINTLGGGGAERVLILLANALVSKGYDVNIITFNASEDFSPNRYVGRVQLHHGNIKNHKLRSILNLAKYYSKKSRRPEVIISFLTPTSFITIPIAKIFGIKIISSEHINHLRSDSSVDSFTRKYLYRFANILTVLTKFDVPYYEKNGVNTVIMPNPSTFRPLSGKVNEREKILLAVGSLNRYHHKGFDNLLHIVKPVFEKYPHWKLKILGKGDFGLKHLQDIAGKLHIENNVEFAGFQSNVSKIMKDSSIFILSSRFEGLPMVLIEAMSQGMACISYNCLTGPSDIIVDEHDGLLIEDQDKEAMTAGIIRLIDDRDLMISLGSNAIKSINKFDIDKIVNKWEKLFHQLNS